MNMSKTVKTLMAWWSVLQGLYPTIQQWVEAIDYKGDGATKKAEVMEAVKMSVETTEKLTGIDLPWEGIIEPLASALVEMAVRTMQRKQAA